MAVLLHMRFQLLDFTRRQFLISASMTTVAAVFGTPVRADAIEVFDDANESVVSSRRLDGGWQFRQGPVSGQWQVWRAEENDEWHATGLPHCFNAMDACDPDVSYFRGQGSYRTRIEITNPFVQGRTMLHFQGAGQTTTVWVGQTLVGTHKGGYDEFSFDITDAIKGVSPAETKGGIPVCVVCDNAADLERAPSDQSDFCLYGGLYRHVSLVYLPALGLEMVHVLPILGTDGTTRVSVKARLYNPTRRTSSCEVATRVLDGAGQVVHESTKTLAPWEEFRELADFSIATPQLWSPETPHLYRCAVTLTSAENTTRVEEKFGVRRYEFLENGPFHLNGKRVLLRGTHRHADHAGVAAAMSDEQVRQELQLIREMGANFIRLAHYQQDRLVLNLCDELGLMVWEEVPWCRAGVGDEAFKQQAQGMLTHMIEQHYNHPSIILWGLGNEDDWPDEYPSIDKEAIREFMTEMRDLAHRLDGSRLTSFRRCDFARDIPDVYSPSIWAGWYGGNYRDYETSLTTQRGRVKRLLHAEWGAESHAGRHSEDPEAVLRNVAKDAYTDERGLAYLKTGGPIRVSKDGDWSETYACRLFDWHLKTQEKLDWLTGSAQWIFKDFASPLRGDSCIPRINQKGLVERDLTKKESYFVFQSYWTEKPMAHIYGHSWPVRWGREGQLREVLVYSNCEQAELFLNEQPLGSRRRDSQNFPAAGLRWDVAFAKGDNRLRVVATQGDVTVTDQIELVYATEEWGKPTTMKLTEKRHDAESITVDVTLYDPKGLQCLDARDVVRFSVAGDGRLIDNLGTVHGSREVQLANGRAEISIVRKGECVLGVTAQGIPPTFLEIP